MNIESPLLQLSFFFPFFFHHFKFHLLLLFGLLYSLDYCHLNSSIKVIIHVLNSKFSCPFFYFIYGYNLLSFAIVNDG